MDMTDKLIIQTMQQGFPLYPRPYHRIAEKVEITEAECIARVKSLKQSELIKFIGAVINTASMGFNSLLVAFKIKEALLDDAVAMINAHPGVSHNYLRNDEYNLWFTIAEPREFDLKKTIEKIFEHSLADSYLLLPAIKKYKLNFNLDVLSEQPVTDKTGTTNKFSETNTRPLTRTDYDLLKLIQYSLPIEEAPYDTIGHSLGVTGLDVISMIQAMLKKKVLRSFKTIVAQRRVGYDYNAMVVWDVNEPHLEHHVNRLVCYQNTSHCYLRPTYPDWPYSLYSMIHTRTADDFQEILGSLLKESPINKYKTLISTKEFKKKRIMYFTDEYERWHDRYGIME